MEDVFRWSFQLAWIWSRVLLIALNGVHRPLSVKLNFVATNNVAEYEAYIVGLEALLAIDVKKVEIYRTLHWC